MKNFKFLKSLSFICLMISLSTYSQDIILKTNGDKLESKVTLIEKSNIHYKKYSNLDGPDYVIDKKEVVEIKFENGIVEKISSDIASDEISLEETKNFIIKEINEHGFEEDTFKKRYRASFEGEYLRLIVLRANGEEANHGLLYDFSNVYKFHNVSKRSDELAFLNIFVSMSQSKKEIKWDKHKLIMRVDGLVHAEAIQNALKHYNKLLIQNSRPTSRF